MATPRLESLAVSPPTPAADVVTQGEYLARRGLPERPNANKRKGAGLNRKSRAT